jgi:hypothetical protein
MQPAPILKNSENRSTRDMHLPEIQAAHRATEHQTQARFSVLLIDAAALQMLMKACGTGDAAERLYYRRYRATRTHAKHMG